MANSRLDHSTRSLAAKADSGQIIFRVEKINVIYDFTPHFSFDFAKEKLEPELHKRFPFTFVHSFTALPKYLKPWKLYCD